jgi:hypothetical protein
MTDPIAEWLSGSLPRARCTIRAMTRSPKAAVAALIVIAGGVALATTFPDTVPDTRLIATTDQLSGTTMIAALDTTFDADRNTIWCASAPVAWKALKEFLGGDVAIEGAPAWVDALNRRAVGAADIEPAAFVTAVGWIGDGVVEAVQSRLRERFGLGRDALLDEFVRPFGSRHLIAYAFLEKNVEFPEPFDPLPDGIFIRASDGKSVVDEEFFAQAFGLKKFDAKNPRHERIGKHVRIHGCGSRSFVVVLESAGMEGEVILARLAPERTLRATVDTALTRLKLAPERLAHGDKLGIPLFDYHILHSYRDITGRRLLNAGFEGMPCAGVVQAVRFRMNENGADLRSRMICGFKSVVRPEVKSLIFCPPFLVLLKERRAANPFFAMWVANQEVLVRQE